jgi:hypothetical protein
MKLDTRDGRNTSDLVCGSDICFVVFTAGYPTLFLE